MRWRMIVVIMVLAAMSIYVGCGVGGTPSEHPNLVALGAIEDSNVGGDAPAVNDGIQAEDIQLWQAANNDFYYHNRQLISPEPASAHVEVVNRYRDRREGSSRSRLSRLVLAKDIVNDRFAKLYAEGAANRMQLPQAWVDASILASVNEVLRILMKEDVPNFHDVVETDFAGVLSKFDDMRSNEVAKNMALTYLNAASYSMTRQIEAQYREKRGDDRPLKEAASLFIDEVGDSIGTRRHPSGRDFWLAGTGTFARFSYSGDTTLTNVLIVTKCTMKPVSARALAGREFARMVNELSGAGAKRTDMIDAYVSSAHTYHATPRGAVVFTPELRKGDVIELKLYDSTFFWHVQEASVSFYCDQGCIRNKILMKAGPANDLSMESRPEYDSVFTSTPGEPQFTPISFNSPFELKLNPPKDGAEFHTFKGCIPVGATYRATGGSFQIDFAKVKTLDAIARGPDTYVALGPPRTVGHSLILVPVSVLAQPDPISPPSIPEEGKATAPMRTPRKKTPRKR